MSNETKRDVFEDALREWNDLVHWCGFQGEEAHGGCEFDQILTKYKKDYDAALPDDIPVIPKAVSDYISKAKKPRQWGLLDVFWHLGDNISAMGINGLYDWQRWMAHNQVAVARAWVLGVWRVEETGEVVKL